MFLIIVLALLAVAHRLMPPNRKKELSIQNKVLEVDKKRTEPLVNALKAEDFWRTLFIVAVVTFILWQFVAK